MKTIRVILTIILFLIPMVLYSQIETHVHTAYATGTTENIMQSQLYETCSTTVVDWDKFTITINGLELVMEDEILIRNKGVLEFTACSEDGDCIQIQLTNLYMIIKDKYKRASVYIKLNNTESN